MQLRSPAPDIGKPGVPAHTAIVAFAPQACLRIRFHASACEACARACPGGAIELGAQSVDIAAGCLGCGRCQAACPAGALSVSGFSRVDAGVWTRHAAVTVDCWKVPREVDGAAALRVPCLAGLSLGRVLALCAAADPRPLVMLDRGWCAACAAGGDEHPARATLGEAAALMRAAGVPEQRLPRLRQQALPASLMPQRIPAAAMTRETSRRGFFGALAGEVVAAVPAGPAVSAVPAPERPLRAASPERQRVLDALTAFSERHGGCVAAALFHRIEVGEACCNQRVCAAICPTGALAPYRDSARQEAGIAYDSSLCIGCGHCQAVCPERAMRVGQGEGARSRGHVALTRLRQRPCTQCGESCSVTEGAEVLCEGCRKRRSLARAASRQLFGARH